MTQLSVVAVQKATTVPPVHLKRFLAHQEWLVLKRDFMNLMRYVEPVTTARLTQDLQPQMMMMLLKTRVTVVLLDSSVLLKVVILLLVPPVLQIVCSSNLVQQLVFHVVLQVTALVRASLNPREFVPQDITVRLVKPLQLLRIRSAQLDLNVLRDLQLL